MSNDSERLVKIASQYIRDGLIKPEDAILKSPDQLHDLIWPIYRDFAIEAFDTLFGNKVLPNITDWYNDTWNPSLILARMDRCGSVRDEELRLIELVGPQSAVTKAILYIESMMKKAPLTVTPSPPPMDQFARVVPGGSIEVTAGNKLFVIREDNSGELDFEVEVTILGQSTETDLNDDIPF